MPPPISQRRATLEELRERTRQATAEFFQKPGIMPPPLAPLVIVQPIGNNTFTAINRATGKIITERFGHNNGTSRARKLETRVSLFSIKQFGRILRSCAFRISAMLALFVFCSKSRQTSDN